MDNAIGVVRNFCGLWERRDKDAILAAFTEDAVYHNMPMQPAVGKAAIGGLLDFILAQAGDAIRFEITHIAAAGDVVLTERIDTFTTGSKVVTLEVMGVFEVKGGKIAAWRDYFDMARWTSQAG